MSISRRGVQKGIGAYPQSAIAISHTLVGNNIINFFFLRDKMFLNKRKL